MAKPLDGRTLSANTIANAKRAAKAVMHTPEGRALVRYLVWKGGLHRNPFVAGQPDTTAFNTGQQALARHLLELVNGDVNDHLKEVYDGSLLAQLGLPRAGK